MKLLLLALLFFQSCGSSLESRVDAIPFSVSPSGVRIKKEARVDTAKALQIEAALTELAKRARCKGYTKELELKDFTVAVLVPETQVSGIGAIKYSNYASDYIAGIYLHDADIVVVVDQPDLTDIVMHEGSHRILAHNDVAEYQRTAKHAWGVPFGLEPCNK